MLVTGHQRNSKKWKANSSDWSGQISKDLRIPVQLTNYNDWVGITVDATRTFENGWQVDKSKLHPAGMSYKGDMSEIDYNDMVNRL